MGAIHSMSQAMGAGNPMVQAIYGTQKSAPASQPQPPTPPQPSTVQSFQTVQDAIGRGLGMKRFLEERKNQPEEPPAKISKPNEPPNRIIPGFTQIENIDEKPATYDELKNMGAHDIYNIPETSQTAQYKLSSILNVLPTDYTLSTEFNQFRDNLNYLSSRNLLSKHEMSSWMQTLQRSTDPIEDFIQPEQHEELEKQVAQQPELLHQLSLHPEQLIQWMHQPLSPLSYAVMVMGTLEHNEWTPERKQVALRAMQQEAQQNPMMKQGLNWVQQALQKTNGQINPSQRPSYNSNEMSKNLIDGGGGVHQGGDLVKGATDIFEGYTAYRTGTGLGSWARKAQEAVQGESVISSIIGTENAVKVAGGVSRLAPVAERLGEVGAVVGIAEGVNEITTAIGLTKENYIGEGISWIENKVEDAFQNVVHGIGHWFGL
jgi:hypothetical protein